MEENVNKLHFKCADFNSSTRVTVYAECAYVFLHQILSLSLNTMLIVDKHCCDACCDEYMTLALAVDLKSVTITLFKICQNQQFEQAV